MARNEIVPCAAQTWTQLTNANATAVSFTVENGGPVTIQATVGATAPTGAEGMTYRSEQGDDVTLATRFPGVAGANRLWAYARFPSAVFVSHANA